MIRESVRLSGDLPYLSFPFSSSPFPSPLVLSLLSSSFPLVFFFPSPFPSSFPLSSPSFPPLSPLRLPVFFFFFFFFFSLFPFFFFLFLLLSFLFSFSSSPFSPFSSPFFLCPSPFVSFSLFLSCPFPFFPFSLFPFGLVGLPLGLVVLKVSNLLVPILLYLALLWIDLVLLTDQLPNWLEIELWSTSPCGVVQILQTTFQEVQDFNQVRLIYLSGIKVLVDSNHLQEYL